MQKPKRIFIENIFVGVNRPWYVEYVFKWKRSFLLSLDDF